MVKLWESEVPGFDEEFGQPAPELIPYLPDKGHKLTAVIVCPGGGYERKADYEGEPVAKWLSSIGIAAFVLDYRVSPYKHPYPMQDAQRAIRLVRYNSDLWDIDPERIGILGFSAGGHLAATVGTHYDFGNPAADDPVERVSCRPDAMILCYPVITMGAYGHDGSRANLLGADSEKELIDDLSNEKQVGEDTPPTFLWHTADDGAVPVENSLMFAQALSRSRVNFALHIYRTGRHGLGLALGDREVSGWMTDCKNWFYGIGFLI